MNKEQKINILNRLIKVYILFTIMCYFIFLIAPIESLIMYTPFYSFQKYLGVIGCILLFFDLLLTRIIFKGKRVLYLYLICLFSFFSSVITLKYGIKENLFTLTWTLLLFSLFYNYSIRENNEKIKKEILFILNIISFVWAITCIISFFSFFYYQGYYILTDPHSITGFTRQGFSENRLFGIYMSINTASILSGILLIINIRYLLKEKNILKKIYFIFLNFVFFIYIILSGTRSVYYSLFFILFLSMFYFTFYFKFFNKKLFLRLILSLFIGMFTIVIVHSFISITKITLNEIPKLNVFVKNKNNYIKFLSANKNIKLNIKNSNNKMMELSDFLSRKDISKHNISNNRFDIWKDYFKTYKDIGFFGLSPKNYSKYIKDHYKNLYIVEHIYKHYPNMYKNGQIYHPHSGYLMTYVASGLFGIISLFIFLENSILDIIKYLIRNKEAVDRDLYGFIAIIILCLLTVLFDQGLFFISNINSCIFWICFGLVMKITDCKYKIK